MRGVLLIGLLGLTACGPTVVVMKDPKTGEIHECRSTAVNSTMGADALAAKSCADGYEKAGWQRMN